jgi:hypothetical protein
MRWLLFAVLLNIIFLRPVSAEPTCDAVADIVLDAQAKFEKGETKNAVSLVKEAANDLHRLATEGNLSDEEKTRANKALAAINETVKLLVQARDIPVDKWLTIVDTLKSENTVYSEATPPKTNFDAEPKPYSKQAADFRQPKRLDPNLSWTNPSLRKLYEKDQTLDLNKATDYQLTSKKFSQQIKQQEEHRLMTTSTQLGGKIVGSVDIVVERRAVNKGWFSLLKKPRYIYYSYLAKIEIEQGLENRYDVAKTLMMDAHQRAIKTMVDIAAKFEGPFDKLPPDLMKRMSQHVWRPQVAREPNDQRWTLNESGASISQELASILKQCGYAFQWYLDGQAAEEAPPVLTPLGTKQRFRAGPSQEFYVRPF